MDNKKLGLLGLFLIIVLSLAGCASGGTAGGGAMADVTAAESAEPQVDRDEVGDNGLLTPAAVVARYVDAIGGEEAIRMHTSSTAKGTFAITAMGMEGDMVTYAAAPNSVVLNIEMAGMGSMNQGFNGEVGWSDNPMTGPSVLEGDMLAQMKELATFYAPLSYDELFSSQETIELTEFNGESAYKLRLVNAADQESFHYFSETSGLLIGTQGVQVSEMGEAEVTVRLSDYKDWGGVMQPGTSTQEVMGMEIQTTIKEVTWDDVPADAFEPPASIKAMLD